MAQTQYDVGIIGGGIVGCTMLFELTRQGYSCIMMEKNQYIMSEASAGNSGMLHTGFDAPLNSLEQHCIKSGHKGMFDVINKFNIPHKTCGTVLVAWTEKQNEIIPELRQKAHEAGILDVDFMSVSELYKKEPFLRQGAHGTLFVPGETIVDSNLLGLCCAHHATLQGAKILTNCEVLGFKDRTLNTSCGPISPAVTINCAGLYGDLVDNLAGLNTFSIKPRRGQYCVFGKNLNLVNSIIMPVPTEKTKGVGVFNSVYNNLVIGPTAEDVPSRTRPPLCDPKTHNYLTQTGRWIIPELNSFHPVGQYTGIRPATQFKDYQIRTYPQLGWITVGGIRSTGVSASLGTGQYISEKLQSDMSLELNRGMAKNINELHWEVGNNNNSSIIIEGCHYKVPHPIFQYGHQNVESKL
uniref:FAD dependent oxidoreductase domain-containing protein n=1 Tax=Arion vulgaris TaxID=1028688 RepID=A0A0B7AAN9_9EUPU